MLVRGAGAELSRARIQQLIDAGAVSGPEGVIGDAARRVKAGERFEVRIPAPVPAAPQAEDIPLHVVYEDAALIIVDKPAGLVVHPAAGNPGGTLVNALLHFDARMAELPRAGIVHRLDKDTSGLMVVARSLRAHAALVEQLSEREVHRQYVAVVVGPMIAGGTVDAPIDRHPTDRLRQAVVKEGQGRDAVTHYRVRERFRAHTVVECRLETGRTHQIRVHMMHAKHPLIGDPLYGGSFKLPKAATPELAEALRGFKRQALHAEKLEFAHPVDGRTISTQADIPADMQALIGALRADTAAFKA